MKSQLLSSPSEDERSQVNLTRDMDANLIAISSQSADNHLHYFKINRSLE